MIRKMKATWCLGFVKCADDQVGQAFEAQKRWRWAFEGQDVEEELEIVALVKGY